MARFSYIEIDDNSILKLIAAPEIGDTQSTIKNPGVPLPPAKSSAVSDEAKENMKNAKEKALKDNDESKPEDPSKGIDHPDNLGSGVDADAALDYEVDIDRTQPELVDYYDPDDVINADIGDYVPKEYTGNPYDYLPAYVGDLKEIRKSGLYVKSGNNTYFVDIENGVAGDYLRILMVKIGVYLKQNVSGFLKSGFNGVTRSLQETVIGGNNRSRTSKHGAGLAIDLTLDTTKLNQALGKPIDATNTYFNGYYETNNNVLVKDTELTKYIRLFLKTVEDNDGRIYGEIIKWGGDFRTKTAADKKSGVYSAEYHHFEIKDNMMASYFEPIKESLIKTGHSVPQNQDQLGPIYKAGLYA